MKTAMAFLSFLILCSCAHEELPTAPARKVAATQAPTDVEGIWSLQGSHSARGAFTGELELRRGPDGTYNAIRVVNYISYYFEGLHVQEIWTGKALPNKNGLVISYEISEGNFVNEVSGAKKKKDLFGAKTTVNVFFKLNTKDLLEAAFADKSNASYQEWLATKRPLETRPLWQNERKAELASGQKNLSPALSARLKAAKSETGFNKSPFIQKYLGRPEFKNMRAYIVSDITDHDFYQKNNDQLRVSNRFIDSFSLIEALFRRNAYAYNRQQKSLAYDKNLLARHVNEQGLITDTQINPDGTIKYAVNTESGFLTAMYVASQGLRYQSSKESPALENIKKTLPALFPLIDNLETQDADFLPALKQALLWSALVLPKSEISLWQSLKEKSLQLTHMKTLSTGPDQAAYLALAAFINQDNALAEQAKSLYAEKFKKDLTSDHFYWNGSANWHLAFIATLDFVTDIALTEALDMKEAREAAQKQMRDLWSIYEPAKRSLLSFATFGFAYKKSSENKKDDPDAKMKVALTSALAELDQMPLPRPQFDLAYDHSLNTEWSASPIPRNFWLYKKEKKSDLAESYQGLYDFPLFESKSFESSFIWREDAFSFKGSAAKNFEHSGVDYLYAYWLSQYANIPEVNQKK